ncbi:2-succinyl-5-enolpyruvyl-6-hydroxy-3-cyclohexene-1-carboxylic-acid synthase [Waterburya agarophytonicola K14]|uniref:2-succinyl-5-enolpyruvyl-6-hydroxy-3-cyclohexene-1-carboxylate synthase n=1 Tax=Waterburya agarophytonicola KI4 TaxID=2874699 RepID=A0A964BUP7_9CYAN|nr:2-succinyl-5-enolpyruvyl-6-hydroxy-3-cyclohexene-1-carboxylic-acid synthase [Waterburya agarophytonicola]MCC0178487.1 2-succinyl-5-enolpyruvyl-6-hydroxy-3-cyclohexene-1-carboxylic-acid synthase [Waterburya agarophytonicola KI4]
MLHPCGTIDFRNINTLWASVIAETLHRCGITMAIVCPGSRSTPLAIAFANHPQIEAIPILDERSASFFALGRAKKTGLPTVLVCTSGTAGANFYPAVIEAKESGIPLIILTADRPAELRHCHAGQTIDQVKLYGNLPNWQCELALPEANLGMLAYVRQNTIQAWEQSLFPTPGVVHLNLPLRKPLAPLEQPEVAKLQTEFLAQDFFSGVRSDFSINSFGVNLPIDNWQHKSGIIIAGLAQPQDPQLYCQAIAHFSKLLSFPVLAEALSPVRNYASLNPYLISTYDSILRQNTIAQRLIPDVVIQIGELPTSKELRQWLKDIDVERWAIDPRYDNFDPLQGKTRHIHSSIEQLADNLDSNLVSVDRSKYCQQWCELESRTRNNLDRTLRSIDILYEGKTAWLISQSLSTATPVFLANSMSVRNAEYFWQPNNRKIVPYFSRGANGIDGTLSTALGIAYQDRGILLTGDLALLHDTNGFLIAQKFRGHLSIIVINNNGGGIFEMLPIADFPSEFEEYFATPQSVNIAQLCRAYELEHQIITSWQQLEELLQNLPPTGIRVLELICDRTKDAAWLKDNLALFSLRQE